ncbi:hypothetical protein Trydic_g1132 [Trypoxylus dichotomus]
MITDVGALVTINWKPCNKATRVQKRLSLKPQKKTEFKINDEIKHIHVSSIRTYIDCEEENKIRLPVNIRASELIKANEALQERIQLKVEKERNRDLEKPEICKDAEAPQPNIQIPDSTVVNPKTTQLTTHTCSGRTVKAPDRLNL